jgi:hypothetical protein
MRYFLFVLVLLMSFSSFSQEGMLHKPSPIKNKRSRHQLELSPASVWYNKGFFIGHRVRYQGRLRRSISLELESNGTVFRSLDRRAQRLKEDEVFPLLNQSRGAFSMDVFGKGKLINRNKQKRFIYSIRLGYHFFQHSTPYENNDYWAYDSTQQLGMSSIRSFQSHSISAGLGFRSAKYKRLDGRMTQVSSHAWTLDYLGSVYYQLTSYSINDDKNYNIQNIPNPHELRKSGARLNYTYTRYLKSYFGIHFGMEAVIVPFLKDYAPNDAYFVPRGGERILPIFTNVNVGVSFAF